VGGRGDLADSGSAGEFWVEYILAGLYEYISLAGSCTKPAGLEPADLEFNWVDLG
jgi:hypothetical protein